MDSNFRQHKIYADVGGESLEMKHDNAVLQSYYSRKNVNLE